MKKRILAFTLIILICLSLLPLEVFALINYTSTGTAMTDVEWEIGTHNGPTYQMEYYYPVYNGKEFKYFTFYATSLNMPGILYFTEDTVFENNNTSKIIQGEAITFVYQKSGYFPNYNDSMYPYVLDALFNPDSTYRVVKGSYQQMHYYNATGKAISLFANGVHSVKQYAAVIPDNNTFYVSTSSGTEEIISESETENLYANWYFEKNGANPPLAGSVKPSEYLCGREYVIIRQLGQKTESGKYIIDTVDESYEFDAQYIYSVIYPDIYLNDDEDAMITGFEKIPVWLETWYTLFNGVWQNKEYKYMPGDGKGDNHVDWQVFAADKKKTDGWNRYYFTSLTEAVRFAKSPYWSEPVYYEENQGQYLVYNVEKVMYNNFYISEDIPINEPDWNEYGITRTKVFLKQYGVENPEYICVEYDYYPFRNHLGNSVRNGSDLFAVSASRHNATYYKLNTSLDDPIYTNITFYEKTDEYYDKDTQRFLIFTEGVEYEEYEIVWEIISSDYDLFDTNENGITESTPKYETLENDNGDKITINHQTGTLYDENGNEWHYNEETGKYENENGDAFDLDGFENVGKDFDEEILIRDMTNLFEKFTNIINDSKKHTEGITGFIGAVFNRLPKIFTTLILFAVMAILFRRGTGRGD